VKIQKREADLLPIGTRAYSNTTPHRSENVEGNWRETKDSTTKTQTHTIDTNKERPKLLLLLLLLIRVVVVL
jgi:hypothetical protein